MTRVTNKIVPHRKCSFAFRVLVSLKISFKILMIRIYVVCRRVAPVGTLHVTHYSIIVVHTWIIASIRSHHLDGDLPGRDEISALNLFKYIFIEHNIVKFSPHI